MANGRNERVKWLDALRGFAMYCVILGHVTSTSEEIKLLVYSFHMPLFFMISGATFRVEKYESLKQCVIDKAKKLLVPYVLLYLIEIPLWYVNWRIIGSSKSRIRNLLWGLIIGNENLNVMANGALWFLPCLFMVSVLVWWLENLDRRGKLRIEASMLICFSAALCIGYCYSGGGIQHWAVVPMASTFFYLGHLFMTNKDKVMGFLGMKEIGEIDITPPHYIIFGIVLLAVGVSCAFGNGSISMASNDYHSIALMLVSAISVNLVLVMIFMFLPNIKVLDFVGKNSLAYLGFHVPILRFLENFSLTEAFAANCPILTSIVVFVLLIPVSKLVNKICPMVVGKKRQRLTS